MIDRAIESDIRNGVINVQPQIPLLICGEERNESEGGSMHLFSKSSVTIDEKYLHDMNGFPERSHQQEKNNLQVYNEVKKNFIDERDYEEPLLHRNVSIISDNTSALISSPSSDSFQENLTPVFDLNEGIGSMSRHRVTPSSSPSTVIIAEVTPATNSTTHSITSNNWMLSPIQPENIFQEHSNSQQIDNGDIDHDYTVRYLPFQQKAQQLALNKEGPGCFYTTARLGKSKNGPATLLMVTEENYANDHSERHDRATRIKEVLSSIHSNSTKFLNQLEQISSENQSLFLMLNNGVGGRSNIISLSMEEVALKTFEEYVENHNCTNSTMQHQRNQMLCGESSDGSRFLVNANEENGQQISRIIVFSSRYKDYIHSTKCEWGDLPPPQENDHSNAVINDIIFKSINFQNSTRKRTRNKVRNIFELDKDASDFSLPMIGDLSNRCEDCSDFCVQWDFDYSAVSGGCFMPSLTTNEKEYLRRNRPFFESLSVPVEKRKKNSVITEISISTECFNQNNLILDSVRFTTSLGGQVHSNSTNGTHNWGKHDNVNDFCLSFDSSGTPFDSIKKSYSCLSFDSIGTPFESTKKSNSYYWGMVTNHLRQIEVVPGSDGTCCMYTYCNANNTKAGSDFLMLNVPFDNIETVENILAILSDLFRGENIIPIKDGEALSESTISVDSGDSIFSHGLCLYMHFLNSDHERQWALTNHMTKCRHDKRNIVLLTPRYSTGVSNIFDGSYQHKDGWGMLPPPPGEKYQLVHDIIRKHSDFICFQNLNKEKKYSRSKCNLDLALISNCSMIGDLSDTCDCCNEYTVRWDDNSINARDKSGVLHVFTAEEIKYITNNRFYFENLSTPMKKMTL
mmetsp:Transcript_26292/g.32243  ORF Transcript_26292/g.32243 Transcript_26292/m.32243 type:complete len:854 (+) Transcript_26292:221-2782(+)|eukprot:CAMPEP_0194386392 /NCGR_PEP_ID=MMETSP0174-20130528/86017_1 /TAXON_ID=216777 /ORGANISM="Proboscia alata, Strain PI-D3" /LENGTH=853 /DNA_ID=CAMNT_0039175499 /DNA_START=133 /DNA_END=2694 /DNA_ORIENTATION=-